MAHGERSKGATKLAAFLEKHGISQNAAGRALGVSGVTVHDWIAGTKRPATHRREAIATWTRDAVPADSWALDSERKQAGDVVPFRPSKFPPRRAANGDG